MNPCLLVLALAASPALALALAQQPPSAPPLAEDDVVAYVPSSGDAWIDRRLFDINRYAARYPEAFADEMARYRAVPRAYVEAMMKQPDWTSADIYFACALAQVAGQPCRAVVREWSRDHAEGWSGVAARIGVRPGSEQYRRLREGLAQTYARWARPAPE
ncbi:hypothetical protein [Pseudoxanthomonas mexicana]|uniref:hypothetical protein n=1 Tax=Pseudoxanthomonas mexicana TaxID=128785 RepID=UPI00398B204F